MKLKDLVTKQEINECKENVFVCRLRTVELERSFTSYASHFLSNIHR